MELIAERGWGPTFICESDGTQAEDALTMKRMYEEALERYHKAEEIYVTNHKEHICMDHLQAQARIYEILGKYEDAIRYVELQIKYLEEEWNITEGADVDALCEEKRRLIDKIK